MRNTILAIIVAAALSGCGIVKDGAPYEPAPPQFHKIGGGVPPFANVDCSGGVWQDGRTITASHCVGLPVRKNEADIAFGKTDHQAPAPIWREPVRGERVQIWCDVGWYEARYEGHIISPAYKSTVKPYGIHWTAKFHNAGLNYLNGCSGTTLWAMSDGAALGVVTIGNTVPRAYLPDNDLWTGAGIPTSRIAKLAGDEQ